MCAFMWPVITSLKIKSTSAEKKKWSKSNIIGAQWESESFTLSLDLDLHEQPKFSRVPKIMTLTPFPNF